MSQVRSCDKCAAVFPADQRDEDHGRQTPASTHLRQFMTVTEDEKPQAIHVVSDLCVGCRAEFDKAVRPFIKKR